MTERQRPLGPRFLLKVLLYSSVLTVLFVLANLYARYAQEMDEINHRVEQVKETSLPALAQSVWDLNDAQIHLQLQGILRLPDIVSTTLTTPQGDLLTLGEPGQADKRDYLPVRHDKTKLAELELGISYQRVRNELWQLALVLMVTQGIRTFLISLLVVLLVSRMFTRHLESLSEQLQAHRHRFKLDRPEHLRDEFSTLVDALNTLSVQRDQQMAALANSKAELNNQHQKLAEEVHRQTKALRQENERAVLMGELAAMMMAEPLEQLDKVIQKALVRLGEQFQLTTLTLFEQNLVRAHWPEQSPVWPLWSHGDAKKVLREGEPFKDLEGGVLALPLLDQGVQRGTLLVTGPLDTQWMQHVYPHLYRFSTFVAALLNRQQGTQLFTPIGWQPQRQSLWQDEQQGRPALSAMANQQAQSGGYLTVLLWEFLGTEVPGPDSLAELRAAIAHGMPDALLVKLSERLLLVAVSGPGPRAITTLSEALMQELREQAAPLEVHVGGFCRVPAANLHYEQLLEMADGALFQARSQPQGLVIETSSD
ncbi:hypothetical protein [Gallaecimonas sp. GXIMD1310]|uniref:hypothetical protein n=1 Tax=Gallaecimonas sp. GXIMD1310 TaxID=3131926 RepID=UPI00324A504B